MWVLDPNGPYNHPVGLDRVEECHSRNARVLSRLTSEITNPGLLLYGVCGFVFWIFAEDPIHRSNRQGKAIYLIQ